MFYETTPLHVVVDTPNSHRIRDPKVNELSVRDILHRLTLLERVTAYNANLEVGDNIVAFSGDSVEDIVNKAKDLLISHEEENAIESDYSSMCYCNRLPDNNEGYTHTIFIE